MFMFFVVFDVNDQIVTHHICCDCGLQLGDDKTVVYVEEDGSLLLENLGDVWSVVYFEVVKSN